MSTIYLGVATVYSAYLKRGTNEMSCSETILGSNLLVASMDKKAQCTTSWSNQIFGLLIPVLMSDAICIII